MNKYKGMGHDYAHCDNESCADKRTCVRYAVMHAAHLTPEGAWVADLPLRCAYLVWGDSPPASKDDCTLYWRMEE